MKKAVTKKVALMIVLIAGFAAQAQASGIISPDLPNIVFERGASLVRLITRPGLPDSVKVVSKKPQKKSNPILEKYDQEFAKARLLMIAA